MTIYRSLRWGQHVELVMTDQRSYRSDHAIPEEYPPLVNLGAGQTVFFDPRNFLPLPLVNLLDAGAAANGGNPPAMLPAPLDALPNPRRLFPPGTMLGSVSLQGKPTLQSAFLKLPTVMLVISPTTSLMAA